MNLEGKTALVTGGRNGNLGPVWVRLLQEWGAEVVIWDLPEVNLLWPDDIIGAARAMPPPDILVNNAAMDPKPSSHGGIWDSFERIVDINLLGAERVIEVFAKRMMLRGSGLIVNVGSMLGFVAANHQNYSEGFMKPCGYNASKAGLLGLTRSVGCYYGQFGVRCVMLALGPVESPQWQPEFRELLISRMPIKRFVTEDDLRAGLRFCIESPSFNAREVLIDGGYTAV